MDIVDQLRHYPKMVSTDGFRFYKTSDNCATCAEAADTIDSLRAQVAALEQDAKRYRWLRDKFTRIGVSAWPDCDDATDGPAVVRELRVMEHFRPTDAASTDAAIDAAMG